MTLGAKIRALRRVRGLTQRALAGDDLSESFISMLEHGKVRPSLATLRRLAERLQEPLATLLEEDDEPASAVETRLRHGDALARQHRFTQALEQYESALTLAGRIGHARLRAEAHLGLGQALMGLRHFDLATSHLTQAEEQAASLGDPRLRARVANVQGAAAIRRRDFPLARSHLTAGLDLVRKADPPDRDLEGAILGNLGRVYSSLGLPMQALECFEAARPALEASADPTALGLLYFNTGVAYQQQQAFEEAARYLSRAADLFGVQENLQLLGLVKRSLGILMLDRGDAAEGEPFLRQSLSIAERLADDAGRAQTLTELGRAALEQGRAGEAEHLAAEALRLASRVEDPAEAARARAVLGGVARRRNRTEEALAYYHQAVETFRGLKMTIELSEALRDLGFAYLEAGREGEAARTFAQAFMARKVGAAAE